jgi:signal transduction histidine kinase
VNNAVRHAKPTWVRVNAQQGSDEIAVSIQDNGSGFDTRQDKGLGMLGIQERIQGLGGVLDIQSVPARGTVVSILLPLDQLVSAGKAE